MEKMNSGYDDKQSDILVLLRQGSRLIEMRNVLTN